MGGLNLYGYVGNNPINGRDRSGLFVGVDDAIEADVALVGYAAIAIGGAYTAYVVAQHSDEITASVIAAIHARNEVHAEGETCPVPRKPSKQIRKEWEEANGEPWPKDPETGNNQDVSHKKPLADGGTNELDNIEPLPHDDHVQQHKDAGDFARWGSKGAPPPPLPEDD
jgi:hypothetical protein